MLTFSGSLKIFVAVEPCDMRKGFQGLYALASERLGQDPRQGRFLCSSTGAIIASRSSISMERVCG